MDPQPNETTIPWENDDLEVQQHLKDYSSIEFRSRYSTASNICIALPEPSTHSWWSTACKVERGEWGDPGQGKG